MDPNIVAALIGGASGLGGAIIGGVIAARATNKATRQANAYALQLQHAAVAISLPAKVWFDSGGLIGTRWLALQVASSSFYP